MVSVHTASHKDAGACNACAKRDGHVYVMKLSKTLSNASIEIRVCDDCLDELVLGAFNARVQRAQAIKRGVLPRR